MKKIIAFILIVFLSIYNYSSAKKYKFKLDPPFIIEQVRVAKQGTKFVKSWAVAKNADDAIIKAKQNVVAAALFIGISPNHEMGAGVIPPLCSQGTKAYEENKEYFDDFFKKGVFLKYVVDVNSTYPIGENNLNTPQGRKVGVYLQLFYDDLRKRLIQDNIIKALGDQFKY